METEYTDVAIVGGSFAGLSASLQLGRALRTVHVYDTGLPRNRFAHHSHGFLGQDSRKPADILKEARAQLAKYKTVTFIRERVALITRKEAGFEVSVDGQSPRKYRKVILASGVTDQLPPIEGIQDLWGGSVFHCPYCHGYEVRNQKLAVLGSGDAAAHQATLLTEWSKDLVIFANGGNFDDKQAMEFKKLNIVVYPEPVVRLHSKDDKLKEVELSGGERVKCDAILTASITHPGGDYWKSLGCAVETTPLGSMISTNPMKESSVTGVFAAGDIARAPHSVTFAVADGAMAGIACHRSLLMDRLA